MTYRNTRPEGFRSNVALNAKLRALHNRPGKQLDTDESRVWFGSREAGTPAGEDRAVLDRRAEEASENEGMAEHADKARAPAEWSRDRVRRTAG